MNEDLRESESVDTCWKKHSPNLIIAMKVAHKKALINEGF